jgi:hypothetical protein
MLISMAHAYACRYALQITAKHLLQQRTILAKVVLYEVSFLTLFFAHSEDHFYISYSCMFDTYVYSLQ